MQRKKKVYQYKTNYQKAVEAFSAEVVINARKIKSQDQTQIQKIIPTDIPSKHAQQQRLLFDNSYASIKI